MTFPAILSGIAVRTDLSALSRTKIDDKVKANMYRIAQEALNNIHKHAEAKNVVVELKKDGSRVTMTISDDGRGFILKKDGIMRAGIGLTGMKKRAALAGGTFDIESSKENGTNITVSFPNPLSKKTTGR